MKKPFKKGVAKKKVVKRGKGKVGSSKVSKEKGPEVGDIVTCKLTPNIPHPMNTACEQAKKVTEPVVTKEEMMKIAEDKENDAGVSGGLPERSGGIGT